MARLRVPGLIFFFLAQVLRSAFCDVTTPHLCKEDGKCYTVILDQQLTWEKAEEYCENNLTGGRLASVHNAFDNNLIASWLPFLSSNPWIGAFRIGSLPFSWTDGTDFGTQYTNWVPGQPADRCAQICRSTTSAGNACQQGKWTTADCSSQAQLICEYGNWSEVTTTLPPVPSCPDKWILFSATQACYRIFFHAASWDDAEATCRDNGGHMASIHSDAENDFIGDLSSEHAGDEDANHQTWIGMQDLKHNGRWVWSDGTVADYFHWATNEPDNSTANDPAGENCVEMITDNSAGDPNIKYHWNDFTCDGSMRAIACKRQPNLSG